MVLIGFAAGFNKFRVHLVGYFVFTLSCSILFSVIFRVQLLLVWLQIHDYYLNTVQQIAKNKKQMLHNSFLTIKMHFI